MRKILSFSAIMNYSVEKLFFFLAAYFTCTCMFMTCSIQFTGKQFLLKDRIVFDRRIGSFSTEQIIRRLQQLIAPNIKNFAKISGNLIGKEHADELRSSFSINYRLVWSNEHLVQLFLFDKESVSEFQRFQWVEARSPFFRFSELLDIKALPPLKWVPIYRSWFLSIYTGHVRGKLLLLKLEFLKKGVINILFCFDHRIRCTGLALGLYLIFLQTEKEERSFQPDKLWKFSVQCFFIQLSVYLLIPYMLHMPAVKLIEQKNLH